jgi:ferritin-like protein
MTLNGVRTETIVLHRADVCTASKLEAAVATVAARVRKYSELLDMCQSIDARRSQLAKRVKSLREFQEHPLRMVDR